MNNSHLIDLIQAHQDPKDRQVDDLTLLSNYFY